MAVRRERLSTFLSLPAKSIGHVAGGRKRTTGLVDVALIQRLIRKGVRRRRPCRREQRPVWMVRSICRIPLHIDGTVERISCWRENGYFVLRFLAEDVGRELDAVLDAGAR
jgi:hypothetical protein